MRDAANPPDCKSDASGTARFDSVASHQFLVLLAHNSMAECPAVNRSVVGSSPTVPANYGGIAQ